MKKITNGFSPLEVLGDNKNSVPNAPRRAERAHAEADYDEETARDNYFNPPAGHRTGPGGPTNV